MQSRHITPNDSEAANPTRDTTTALAHPLRGADCYVSYAVGHDQSPKSARGGPLQQRPSGVEHQPMLPRLLTSSMLD